MILCAALVAMLASESAPGTMTKIVTRDVSPSLPANHFARQPKTLYRSGTCCVRIEEQRDGATGQQLLMVVNEPDIWIINLEEAVAHHVVDPGPSLEAHARIVEALHGLELGRELEFMLELHATKRGPFVQRGVTCYQYSLSVQGHQVELLIAAATVKPIEIRVSFPDGRKTVLAYDIYDTGLAFDKDIFRPPDGVTVRDSK